MKKWIAFLRSRPTLPFVILFLILLYPDRARPQITEPGNPVLEFTNGRWFDGNVFREKPDRLLAAGKADRQCARRVVQRYPAGRVLGRALVRVFNRSEPSHRGLEARIQ